ncbi:MAG: SDR family NAD(P)-dependent oxidoreductase [Hyphomicrobiaceae bacterium]
MENFDDKVAIVTGASRGIGEATARAFVSANARVVLAARSMDHIQRIAEDIGRDGGQAIAVQCDVSDYGNVKSAVDRAVEKFGRLDFLVNNAGAIDPIARLADSDPETWARVADINYKGVYYGLRAAIPIMTQQGSGVIVNISSGAATSPLEGWSHYCSSKAAVLMLTRCADKEYRERGLRVVGLSPGTVATDMQVAIKASGINPVSQLDPSVHIPPQWVGQAVVWLCSDAAADISGCDFSLKDDEAKRQVGLVS